MRSGSPVAGRRLAVASPRGQPIRDAGEQLPGRKSGITMSFGAARCGRRTPGSHARSAAPVLSLWDRTMWGCDVR